MPDIAPPLFRLLTVLLLCSACTRPNPAYRPRVATADATPPSPDAAPPTDAAAPDSSPPPDTTTDLDPTDSPLAATDSPLAGTDSPLAGTDTASSCGAARPDIAAIAGADGLAMAADGTLYFTSDDGSHGFVGRMLPGQTPDAQWLRLDWAPLTAGLALDEARSRLYVASISGRAILTFDMSTGTVLGSVLLDGLDDLNDLAHDGAGNIYYSLQSDRHIYRVDPQGVATRVSLTPLGDSAANQAPAGLAFAPDGSLFVGLKHAGPIYRLVLAGGLEQSRAPFGAFDGWANGLAFDSAGRLYVGVYDETDEQRVLRMDADGSNLTEQIPGGRYSSLVFGRGPLDCRDLYAANPHGPLQRLPTDTPGLPPR